MNALYNDLATEVKQLITAEQAWYYRIVPVEKTGDVVRFLTDADRGKEGFESEINLVLGIKSNLDLIGKDRLESLLSRHYPVKKEEGGSKIGDHTTRDFVSQIISEASQLHCSDIHLEPMDVDCRIRFRLDGELQERYRIARPEYLGLVNRIKILGHLDISERRLPQDGRIQFNDDPLKIDIRVSIVPTIKGEKVVLRLLGSDASHLNIGDLGFSHDQERDFVESLKKTKGIILISGPTGSGKTTTLYATLKILNTQRKNILTVEDPVEYTLDGINQVQAKEDIGLGFAKVLKSFLRQDPDIIMLGEIRDEETAMIAVRLALTGHLVLSTIHTNSSWGTLSRLTDMGIPPYLLADTLVVSMAQRLVRKLCPHCKKEEPFDKDMLPRNFRRDTLPGYHFKAVGCNHCFYSGYSGRMAIYEVIPIDHELSDIIRKNELHSFSYQARNIMDLKSSAYSLFAQGITSLEEIYPILLD